MQSLKNDLLIEAAEQQKWVFSWNRTSIFCLVVLIFNLFCPRNAELLHDG